MNDPEVRKIAERQAADDAALLATLEARDAGKPRVPRRRPNRHERRADAVLMRRVGSMMDRPVRVADPTIRRKGDRHTKGVKA